MIRALTELRPRSPPISVGLVTRAKSAIRFRARAVPGFLFHLFPGNRMDIIGAAEAVVPTRCTNCVGDSGRLTMSRDGFVSD